jgi:FK506-binding protein 1
MGVKKIMLRRGNGVDIPKKHDEVSMEYTGKGAYFGVSGPYLTVHVGWLFDDKKPDKKGKQCVAAQPVSTIHETACNVFRV